MREREATETALADLRIEKAKVDGERKAVEADLGPVRYLATLLGSTDAQTMRYFHPDRGAAARPYRRPAALGGNAWGALMTPDRLPPVDRNLHGAGHDLAERSNGETDAVHSYCIAGASNGAL